MNGTVKKARIAGLFYLVMALTGPLGLMIAPGAIVIAGDGAATTQNLLSHEMLFRASIVSNFLCQTSFVFLVLALSHLFKDVAEYSRKLMLALVLVSVPISFAVELFNIAALLTVKGQGYLTGLNQEQLNAMVLWLLNMHDQGIIMVGLFWGLWLFPFGYLVIKSGFIPKLLGYLLMLGCLGYVMDCLVTFLIPQWRPATEMLIAPLGIGEIATMLWLLIKGVKRVKNEKAVSV